MIDYMRTNNGGAALTRADLQRLIVQGAMQIAASLAAEGDTMPVVDVAVSLANEIGKRYEPLVAGDAPVYGPPAPTA